MNTQLSFYRTKSAMQMDFIPPTFNAKGGKMFLDKQGALLLQAANGVDRKYNWENRISFAIQLSDLPALLGGLERWKQTGKVDAKLIHDPNAGTSKKGDLIKTLTLKNGTTGSYSISLSTTGGDSAFVYLNDGEMLLLYNLLSSLIPYMMGVPFFQPIVNNLN